MTFQTNNGFNDSYENWKEERQTRVITKKNTAKKLTKLFQIAF